jgi:hypothetical protein
MVKAKPSRAACEYAAGLLCRKHLQKSTTYYLINIASLKAYIARDVQPETAYLGTPVVSQYRGPKKLVLLQY